MLDGNSDVDETYVNKILPAKMYYNLRAIKNFGFWREIGVMFKTVFAVFGKEYKDERVKISSDDTNKKD